MDTSDTKMARGSHVIACILGVIFMNIVLIHVCTILGCYEISFMNIFRVNLMCNTCTNISYNIQKYQMQIYFAIGGFFVKKVNQYINEFVKLD